MLLRIVLCGKMFSTGSDSQGIYTYVHDTAFDATVTCTLHCKIQDSPLDAVDSYHPLSPLQGNCRWFKGHASWIESDSLREVVCILINRGPRLYVRHY